MKAAVKRMLARSGYQVTRGALRNRFDATTDVFRALRAAAYAPRVIIDGGANVGEWTLAARAQFPGAAFHLIEPQPACAVALRSVEDVRWA